MSAKLIVASFGITLMLAASTGARAHEASARGKSNEILKPRPATALNNGQKYRPKGGCFATGTRDTSGNTQFVC